MNISKAPSGRFGSCSLLMSARGGSVVVSTLVVPKSLPSVVCTLFAPFSMLYIFCLPRHACFLLFVPYARVLGSRNSAINSSSHLFFASSSSSFSFSVLTPKSEERRKSEFETEAGVPSSLTSRWMTTNVGSRNNFCTLNINGSKQRGERAETI